MPPDDFLHDAPELKLNIVHRGRRARQYSLYTDNDTQFVIPNGKDSCCNEGNEGHGSDAMNLYFIITAYISLRYRKLSIHNIA